MLKRLLAAFLFVLLLPALAIAQGMNGLITSVGPTVASGLTRYHALQASGGAWNTTETMVHNVMPVAGTFSKFRVCLSGTSGTGSRQFTIRKNGASGGITKTITNATCAQDLVNSFSVNAGDTVSIEQVTSGTLASVTIRWSIQFQATTTSAYPLLMNSLGAPGSGGLNYYNPQGTGSNTLTETNAQVVMPTAGNITNMYVQTDAAVSATNLVITLRKNGADQSLATTLAAGATTGNASGSISYAAGDLINIKSVKTGGSGVRFAVGLTFAPTTDGESIAMCTSSTAMLQNTTAYSPAMGGVSAFPAAEVGTQSLLQAGIIKSLYGRSVANVGGAAQTLSINGRVNTATSALTCNIASGANTCNYTSSTVTVADDDLLSYQFVNSATTGNTQPNAGMVIMLPTNTPTLTPTPTSTFTATFTPTATATFTPTFTATFTATPTVTPTSTPAVGTARLLASTGVGQ